MSEHPDRTAVVAQAKADLAAAGRDPHSACGAAEITNLAAWRMQNEGAGLLDKPTGNNCQGYAVDIIAYRDGQIYDVLVNAETQNIPAWQPLTPVDPARWRPPVYPSYYPGPIEPPVDPPPVEPPPTSPLEARVARLEQWAASFHP